MMMMMMMIPSAIFTNILLSIWLNAVALNSRFLQLVVIIVVVVIIISLITLLFNYFCSPIRESLVSPTARFCMYGETHFAVSFNQFH